MQRSSGNSRIAADDEADSSRYYGITAEDVNWYFGPRDTAPRAIAPMPDLGKVQEAMREVYEAKGRANMPLDQTPEPFLPHNRHSLKYVTGRSDSQRSGAHGPRVAPSFGGNSITTESTFSTNSWIGADDLNSSVHDGSMYQPEASIMLDDRASISQFEDMADYREPDGAKYNTKLPVYSYRQKIIQLVDSNQVVLIKGGTGSGKSTHIPLFLLDFCQKNKKHHNIVVTQPRRIAAITLSNYVNRLRGFSEHDEGKQIGYQVGLEKKLTETTKLTYMTTGVLLRILIEERSLNKFTHIILDEVHERDYETDFVMLLVKRYRDANPRVKIILMSATIETDIFRQYFTTSSANQLMPPPSLKVEGKSYNVQVFYLENLQQAGFDNLDQVKFCVDNPEIVPQQLDCAVRLIQSFDQMDVQSCRGISSDDVNKGAVLVFLPGQSDILDLYYKLNEVKNRNWQILMCHSELPVCDQRKVFDNVSNVTRKIVLSTNIAESSITVTDVVYVIDFCLSKEMVKDEETGFQSLRLTWASKSNCTQRQGRAGRVAAGKCYRLIRYENYDQLPQFPTCALKRAPLEKVILQIKSMQEEPKNILSNAIEPPYEENIAEAVLSLKRLGALTITMRRKSGRMMINNFDGDLTFVGKMLSALPCDVRIGKLIIYGWLFGVLDETLTIGACLSERGLFQNPPTRMLEAYGKRVFWSKGTHSDLLGVLYAFEEFQHCRKDELFANERGEKNWCRENFIEHKKISVIENLKEKWRKTLVNEDLGLFEYEFKSHNTEKTRVEFIYLAICAAFYPNYFKTHGNALDADQVHRFLGGHPPNSTVVFRGIPIGTTVDDLACYRRQLNHILDACLRVCAGAELYVDASKLYVVFQDSGRDQSVIPSNILEAVYIALRMQKLQRDRPLELNGAQIDNVALSDSSGMFTGGQILQGGDNNSIIERECSRNRGLILKGAEEKPNILEIPIEETLLEFSPVFIHSCCRICVQRSTDEAKHIMDMIRSTINDCIRTSVPLGSRQVKRGTMCFAPYQDTMYRAVIKDHDGTLHATVEFVDYGNSEIIPVSELREINQSSINLLRTPFQCLSLRPIRLQPCELLNNAGMDFLAELFDKYKEPEYRLGAAVYSVTNGTTVNCNIFIAPTDVMQQWDTYNDFETFKCKFGNRILHINEELLNNNFAYRSVESSASERNHSERNYALDSRKTTYQGFKQDAFRAQSRIRVDRIKLQGPDSPLSLKFNSLLFNTSSRESRIMTDSVNCISLDEEPDNQYSKFLVAGCVQVSQEQQHLKCRNTTLMPKIAGYPELMCLLFSPCVELRHDSTISNVMGAICGLGFTHRTTRDGKQVAISNNNRTDLEIKFEVRVDESDVAHINQIRHMMNEMLGPKEAKYRLDFRRREACIHRLRKLTKQLISKPRESNRETTNLKQGYKDWHWNQLDPNIHLACQDENGESWTDINDDPKYTHIFQPVIGVKLNTSKPSFS